jgi:hypothetical protein
LLQCREPHASRAEGTLLRGDWNAAIKQARGLVETVVEEMQGYHDDRSEQWKETTQASSLIERMDALRELIDQFDAAET